MSKKAYIDVIREVGMEGEDPLTIRPHPDDPTNYVELCTISDKAKEYWGEVSLILPSDLAVALGHALIAAGSGCTDGEAKA